jgi:plasmid stability protein
MDTQKRATVYFEAEVHRALRLKAAASDRSISDMVNDAVKAALAPTISPHSPKGSTRRAFPSIRSFKA